MSGHTRRSSLLTAQFTCQWKTRYSKVTSAGGNNIKVETVAEQLLFSTLRIVAIKKDGSDSIGTGFIVEHKWAEDKAGPFLITNKHVIRDTVSGGLTFTLADGSSEESSPALGRSTSINLTERAWQWFGHPSDDIDVAVMPLAATIKHLRRGAELPFYMSIPTDMIPGHPDLESFDAVEEVLFVGYPSGIFDLANNLPIFRKGITATPPSVNYHAKPVFLIDASVFPGSSGSPVFIYNNGSWRTRNGQLMAGQRFFLLGVLASVYLREDNNMLRLEEILASVRPIVRTTQMIDLGIVYKSQTVIETIEHLLRELGEFLPTGTAGTETA